MSRQTYTYTPDDFLDCGEIGEHEVTFTAVVEQIMYPNGKVTYSVEIMKALLKVRYKDYVQNLDVTALIGNKEKWREEIYRDYSRQRDRDWNGDEAS